MELEKEKRVHNVLSNVFYYSFVIIIVTMFILSLVIEEIALLNDILFISLIVSSLVIVFYLTVQMLRYNLTVNKKIQVGIFFVVIGFLLILMSTSKNISFLENLNLSYLGYRFFVYWGIGSIVLGIIVELTFLDQFIWKLFVEPFKQLWKLMVKFAKWVRKHWLNIILYTLDLASLAGIIFVAIFWEVNWWKMIILSVSCAFPIIHHHKRIWNAIKHVAVDMIYLVLTKFYNFFKLILTSIWKGLVNFAKLIKEYWWVILREFFRWSGAAGGGVMIYFGVIIVEYRFLIGLGILTAIISVVFTRKIVLTMLWDVLTSITSFIWDLIVAFARVILKYWWPILKELLRLIGAGGGAYLIYHGTVYDQFSYFIGIGVVVIICSIILSRKTVLIGLWNMISAIFTFIWENIIKPHYKRIINETVRLIFVGVGIFLIYYGIVNEVFYYFVYIGIAVILLAEFFIRMTILRRIYAALKEITLAFWEFIKWLGRPLNYIWKVIVNLTKFFIENWFKVLLYILDLVAITAIIYLSVTWMFEWWYIVLLVISFCYIPVHHYKQVWKGIKFIGIKIFYNPFLRFLNIIVDFFKAIWNWMVEVAKFIKKHWWSVTKELLRLIGVAGGVTLIVYGLILVGYDYLIWIGIPVILISGLFSRKIVLVKIYEFFKAIFTFIFNKRIIISRVIGFAAVIVGVVLYFAFDDIIGLVAFILIVSIGGTFTLFAHFIYHPKKLWKFLVSIPKTIYKISVTILLAIKSVSIYIYKNGIRLILLVVMIFTLVYGIFVIFNFDFFHIFDAIEPAIRISLGAFFDVVAVVAFILLRRELKKLRTGSSKELLKQIRERWKK
ncbi:MAG: hypothetical protein GOP50_12805 [Candidatus Heimdallarchaeota archaeon]|nr:hypothetical protein [Candidatus Heimdallarchaeota archaeon]